ncbi:cytochrome c oxidase subunit II [Calothrix sp. NIES-4071]|nr:cytochrome c oxidase subunit II [Calothrix sp. NIES-4071]BAZ57036.1 cytochrome c oxidase subunit II [Calothrix sp. NIES-4105]
MNIRNLSALSVGAVAVTAASLWMGQQAYSWFPPQATVEAQLIDDLFSFLVVLASFIFFGVTAAFLYAVAFHRAPEHDTSDGPPIEGNITLEVVWTAIPIVLVIWIAGYSYQIYDQMSIRGPMEHHLHMPMGMESAQAAPWDGLWNRQPKQSETPALESETDIDITKPINVIARQWAWEFHYPYKNVSSTELHIPVNERVHLALESSDVLHGFFVPAFRVKQDIIPKNKIDFEFTPTREGTYRLMDSQFSGTYFATMNANVVVDSLENYKNWLKQAANQKPAPAINQAATEYALTKDSPFKTGWKSIEPAEPPVVNYSG